MNKSVLIVDDQALIRQAISGGIRLYARSKYEVVGTASNGLEALEKFEILQPDIVFMDIEMPEMDGLKCLAHMLAIDSSVKIIIISSIGKGAVAIEALSKGAAAVINKSDLDVRALESVLDSLEDIASDESIDEDHSSASSSSQTWLKRRK